jgi:CRISPR-associated protein Csd2
MSDNTDNTQTTAASKFAGTYHFPKLWEGKQPGEIVTERHDIVLLFDATNCNPNGDPDTGNMPRLQPDTQHGLVTDVCLKRKIRNFFAQYDAQGNIRAANTAPAAGDALLIREGNIIEAALNEGTIKAKAREIFATYKIGERQLTVNEWEPKKKGKAKEVKKGEKNKSSVDGGALETTGQDASADENTEESSGEKSKGSDGLDEYRKRAYRDAICAVFIDVRYFGGVVSTEGPLKGSFYGQIRGPIQIAFSESLDKALQLDFSITRCAVASEKEAKKETKKTAEKDDGENTGKENRTMGRKYNVAYGLYRTHIHFSPAFAAKTNFTYADLDNFFFALTRCFGDYNIDASSARPEGMRIVGLVDFAHTSSLGNAPAHQLFNLVKVTGVKNIEGKFVRKTENGEETTEISDFPQNLSDYTGDAPDGPIYAETNNYDIVSSCTTQKSKDNDAISNITARRLIWEITSESRQEI